MVPVVAGQPMPDPADVDAIAVLGSAQGAWDDDVPWLEVRGNVPERVAQATAFLDLLTADRLDERGQ